MNNQGPPKTQEDMVCRLCQHRGSDVQFKGCGCTLHARCVPLSLIIGEGNPGMPTEGIPPPVDGNRPCPVCKSGIISGMYLFPLSLNRLDRAVELRKKCARAAAMASSASSTNDNGKRQREIDDDFHEVQAESSYLLLSHTRTNLTSTMSMETDLHRTGRWTTEEIAFVDFLLNAFDRGMLTLPHGIKLNEFLGDVLLCKSSRLTKKMKNARLSTRSYELRPPLPNSETLDTVVMSTLQEKFLQSLSSEPTQLELLFNLTKLWRTHFSNLCLQVGYSFLDATDWVNSLEAMERRASEAEELIRKARRKRMGLALKTDVKSSNPGVFFADLPVAGKKNTIIPTKAEPKFTPATVVSKDYFDCNETSICSDESSDADFIAHMLELSSQPGPDGRRNRLLSMDLGPEGLDDLFETPEPAPTKDYKGTFDNGPFLQELVSFMEKNHLPFVHVDVWVPSYVSDSQDCGEKSNDGSGDDQLRLYHAGYATRNDVNPGIAAQFNEFGEYSRKFSFAPGVGLPGRVFASGQPEWSSRVDLADPRYFERAGGARIYGVKTVMGLPLSSSIGKVVVALYTMADIQRNDALIEKCVAAFAKYVPEPKWRLIVEMGSKDNAPAPSGRSGSVDFMYSRAGSVDIMNGDIDFSTCFDMDEFGGIGSTKPPAIATAAPTASGESKVAAVSSESEVVEEEHKIATLLGEYMPLSQVSTSVGEPTVSSTGAPDFLNEFMQLRLLLLRPRSRRSDLDNELIDVLRKSFQGYSSGNRRTGSELATLLVKDWRFLKGASAMGQSVSTRPAESAMSSKPPQIASSQHQCHVMDAPNVNTYSVTGAPTKPPSSLNFGVQLPMLNGRGRMDSLRGSFDSGIGAPGAVQRRISVTSEVPDSPQSNHLNIVSEGF